MKLAGTIFESGHRLSESQRSALLNLLGDEDPAVYQAVRQRILASGPSATDWLRPHTLSRDPAVRRRAREIVRCFDRHDADDSFLAFCLRNGEELDIETGAWMLARTQYPDINVEAYRALLDSYANDLRERLDLAGELNQLLAAINHYLFVERRLTGNQENYYDPDNSYLNRVLDRRTGNPVSLCLVYLLLARRLRLPVAGIGLPGHFLCRYQSSSAEVYLDVFHHGKLLTKADCMKYLVRANLSVRDDYLSPISSRRLLLRLCANLHQIYLQLELPDEATRLQRYLVALAR
jgi:regulator of sirC expression with transglutaminase-like and TPR domain